MQDNMPGPSDVSLTVKYQEFAGSRNNAYLMGKGTLSIQGSGPAAVLAFSGTKRQSFSLSRKIELTFRADQISNVVVAGKCIQFDTLGQNYGAEKKPFVFFCPSLDDAATVASRLPEARDEDFIASRQFNNRLDQLSRTTSPWRSITNLLVAANALVFVAMGLLGAGWFEVGDMTPYIRYGANNAAATTDGEWWRLLSSMFMHYGLIHLLLNMWALFQAGHLLEKLLGRALYTLTYFGSGLVGGLVSLLWHGDKVWSAGASGAVFGVYGALLGYMLREKHALPRSVYQPLVKSSLGFAGYNLVFGMIHPRIDNAAHIGGLVGGIVFGWLLALPVDASVRTARIPRRLGLGVAVLAFAIGIGITLAPRYEYRVRDELTWGKINEGPAAKEREVLNQQGAALRAFQTSKNAGNLVHWINSEGIPFNETWLKSIEALQLAPRRKTAQKREWLVKILQLRDANYRQLLAAIETSEPHALESFRAGEQAIALEIQKVAGSKPAKPK